MSYSHIIEKEQFVISHLKIARISLREIGRHLGRHHTSISREIKRNQTTYADNAVYWYYVTERKHIARSHRRQKYLPLVSYVEDKLRLD